MRTKTLPWIFLTGAALGSSALPLWAQEEEESPSPWLRLPNVGYGPFDAVSLSPFSSLRSGLIPQLPSSLTAGAIEARLDQSWAKVISSTNSWLLDYEILRTNAAFSWGITDQWRLDAQLDASERTGGGALQRVILGFHKTFGVTTSYLTPYPGDANRFEITPPGGATIQVPSNDPQPEESSLGVSIRDTLSHGDESLPAVAWALSLRRDLVPGDLRGGLPIDLALSLGASKSAGPVFFYLGADVEAYGVESFFGLKMRPTQESVRAAVEWQCLPGFSLTGQYLWKTGAVSRLEDFSRPSNEIAAGLAWEIATGVVFEVGVLENVVNPYNTPDFGFHFALAVRF